MNLRDYKKYSVACQEVVTCPTAEETLPIELVMEAQHKDKYENYSTGFFIRDISEFCMGACTWEAKMLGKQRCRVPHGRDPLGHRIYLQKTFSFCTS